MNFMMCLDYEVWPDRVSGTHTQGILVPCCEPHIELNNIEVY